MIRRFVGAPAELAHGMMSAGARIARAVNRVLRRLGAVLADRHHLRVLRTPREVRNVLAYIQLSFRKHAGEVGGWRRDFSLTIDPASSGRWFTGWTRAHAPPRERAPVAPAGSWLLRVGWRRHGPIDPAEILGTRR